MTVFDLAADWSWMNDYCGFKLEGGRTIYEQAVYNSNGLSNYTRISYLATRSNMKVRQVSRYVKNSTKIELVKIR